MSSSSMIFQGLTDDVLVWRLGFVPLILLGDYLLRDPVRLLGLPHPVRIIGGVIAVCERALWGGIGGWQTFAGTLGVVLVLVVTVAPLVVLEVWISSSGVFWFEVGWLLLSTAIAVWLLAARGLYNHVAEVRDLIGTGDLVAGRMALRNLAGRQVETLDSSAVLRTAGESLAENFSDAVIAPLLYFVVLGLPGMVAYKALNSLDSMWGYRNERYRHFGMMAARLDDGANLIPARLSALFLLMAGSMVRKGSLLAGMRTLWRDAARHPSPNAGYPEAAMAGIAGLCFGGPRVYDGGIIETTWIGNGRTDWRVQDLDFCLELYRRALLVLAVVTVLGAFLWRW